MGQKVNPIGLRLGITRTWNSRWYEEKSYSKWLHEDIRIKNYVRVEHWAADKNQQYPGISLVEIERAPGKVKINLHTAKPGIVIGKKGGEVEKLKKAIQKLTESDVYLNIVEVRKAELNAQLVAENVAMQLERRVAFRRAMKKAVTNAMKLGAKGIRIACAGRLGGAEMARREWYREGRVPLHTLRADIDYGLTTARTTYGAIGVKTWIFQGEILPDKRRLPAKK